jgi:hypothetical protein
MNLKEMKQRQKDIFDTVTILKIEMPKVFGPYATEVHMIYEDKEARIFVGMSDMVRPLTITYRYEGFLFKKELHVDVWICDMGNSYILPGILHLKWIQANVKTPADYYLSFHTPTIRMGGDWQ